MHRHMRTHKQHQNNQQRRNSQSNKQNNNNSQQPNNNNNNNIVTNNSSNITISTTTTTTNTALDVISNGLSFESGAESDTGVAMGATIENDEVDNSSTDSSCHSSNNLQQTNDITNNKINNNNIDNINNNNNNNNLKINNNLSNCKRKRSFEHDKSDDSLIPLMNKQRRIKTTINNNNILNEDIVNNQTNMEITQIMCPVCEESNFSSLLILSEHMDAIHPDIPAKCRLCEVVFRTHRQLNVHPCSGTPNLSIGALKLQKPTTELTKEAVENYVPPEEQSREQIEQENGDEATDSKDFADIQSILNMTNSSCTSNFLKNFEQNVNTPSSSYSMDKDDEEAQDAFTAEFRKMKLRGEFPCKLCTAVYPNLRALKGHNRIHLAAAGAAGPFRCNMCPFSICDKAVLVRHMRTHNGDRPYECAVCNYAFTTKANCERHLRNRHGKTTRDEVKRAIIYHPCEDSNCDDSGKKLGQIYASTDFEDDMLDLPPKDRSTPVSHLKDILLTNAEASHKPLKIQVKSLEQLLDKSEAMNNVSVLETEREREREREIEADPEPEAPSTPTPIDLSMDVLDLSKKPAKTENKIPAIPLKPTEVAPVLADKIDYLTAQQQIMEKFPLDPAQYIQQFYRQFMFQSINPFFMQNSLLANNSLTELQNFSPIMSRLFATPNPLPLEDNNNKQIPANELPALKATPPPPPPTMSQRPSPVLPAATVLPGGPVKMVIKNGVLMPKQKQRRYRTERPFACEHCSARFTLRSNMERHVKQQHPQYYAQRQRSTPHVLRGRGATGISQLQAAFAQQQQDLTDVSPISEQVKYAILAQQLKAAAHKEPNEFLQQALAHGTNPNMPYTPSFSYGNVEDDEPKLIIDEDDEGEEEGEEEPQAPTQIPSQMPKETIEPPKEHKVDVAKKVADNILVEAMKVAAPANNNKPALPAPLPPSSMKSMIAHAESVGKFLKEVASSPFKDESQDLVPVSKLVDNATSNSVSFNSYFRPSDVANHMEQSDEEGLVASGSASESNNSGTEDVVTNAEPKKKSAYSLAPNRVSCPYCQRMFPWSSSLRRHILTHTGQKPFKCSHCPLLFTTKSNCDRHLLRKHGNVESAMSVYVPTEDVCEPIPVPKSVEEIEQQQRQQREEQERRRQREAAAAVKAEQDRQQQELLKHLASNNSPKTELNGTELPYKCHLCESSFGERCQCLEHIKQQHTQEFTLLLAKGAIDMEAEMQTAVQEEEERRELNTGNTGKYPDYSNRKVICAFCMRRFWSTEDLRRHMRTHSGERPFQCEICLRKFTLKHSMLRHMKKHNGRNYNGSGGSDISDDEQMPTTIITTNNTTSPTITTTTPTASALSRPKIQELLNKASEWRHSRLSSALGEQKENIAEDHHNQQSDLIGNLLGISDQGILNKLLSSPDEAAKFLGVEK